MSLLINFLGHLNSNQILRVSSTDQFVFLLNISIQNSGFFSIVFIGLKGFHKLYITVRDSNSIN